MYEEFDQATGELLLNAMPRRKITIIGRTVVYADFSGPYLIVRDGRKVGCVCDEVTGIQCVRHAPVEKPVVGQPRRPDRWIPSPIGRFGGVRQHRGD